MSTPEKTEFPFEVPRHVGIIMDGNGRWAKERGLSRSQGHRQGVENLKRVLEACGEFGIEVLTIYAFSTENWKRPRLEVQFLIRLVDYYIDRELQDLHEKGVQLRHIGRLDVLQPALQRRIQEAIDLTKDNDTLILNVAFNYGGRDEIIQAARRIIEEGLPAEEVTEETFSNYLYTAGLPDTDLIIRTGGEMRISNFLIWQSSYAEYYSTPTYWPDFGREELRQAVEHYGNRERRYGAVTEP
jgi:undecaprenyl diphosphate synthase